MLTPISLYFAMRHQVESNTAFLRAARAGDLEKLVEFLDVGEVTDINACNAVSLIVRLKRTD